MTDKAYAVPLHELLANVPKSARLVITDPDGKGTRFIPVGRYCHEAAEALRAALAQPEPDDGYCQACEGNYCTAKDGCVARDNPPQREWVGLTEKEILADDVLRYHFALNGGAGPISKKGKTIIEAIEEKLKDKNGL